MKLQSVVTALAGLSVFLGTAVSYAQSTAKTQALVNVQSCTSAPYPSSCMTTANFPTAFADANYAAVCTRTVNTGVYAQVDIIPIYAQTSTSLTFYFGNGTSNTTNFGLINCVATHN